jgi:Prophage CP4-57 regulatory protein (AlpA)
LKEDQTVLVDFKYLEAHGIVSNRMALARAMELYDFPRPFALGPNMLRWKLDEVEKWVASRPRRGGKIGFGKIAAA